MIKRLGVWVCLLVMITSSFAMPIQAEGGGTEGTNGVGGDIHSIVTETPFYATEDLCATDTASSTGTGTLYGIKYPKGVDDDKLADAIDAYIKKTVPSSPMLNTGKQFVEEGKEYGFNPLLAVSQAQIETSFGTAGVGKNNNNAFGLRATASSFQTFSKVEDSITAYYKNNKKLYSKKKDLADFIHTYAPSSDGNDEAAYVKNIESIMKEILKSGENIGGEEETGMTSGGLAGAIADHILPKAYAASTTEAGSQGVGGDLDGHKLPALEGGMGFEESFPSYALGSPKNKEEDDWYITMRWRYAKWNWNGTSTAGPEKVDFYSKHPKLLVTNPRTKKNAIMIALEAGPAPWTGVDTSPNNIPKQGWTNPQDGTPDSYKGRVSGMLPGAANHLGATMRMSDGSGDDLLFAWAPDQNAKLGPTDLAVGSTDADGKCSATPDVGEIDFKKDNAFPGNNEKIKPTMLILHYSVTAPSSGIDGLKRALKGNPSCGAGGCAVQLGADADGTIWQLTKTLDTKAAHVRGFNDRAIGIEIIGMNEQDLLKNEAQFNAVVAASIQIMKKYNIKSDLNIREGTGLAGHYEVNPGDKIDPGKEYMAKAREAIKKGLGE